MSSFSPFGATLWCATGAPAPVSEPLSGLIQADICIVGAGYTGLTTALELARAGVDVILLERKEIGFGGSGRRPIWQDDIETVRSSPSGRRSPAPKTTPAANLKKLLWWLRARRSIRRRHALRGLFLKARRRV